MKFSTFLLISSILSPIAAAPGEDGVADAAAMDMSMPAVENTATGQEADTGAPAKDGGKGGKDAGADAAAGAPAGDVAAGVTETVAAESTNATAYASGNSTDASGNSTDVSGNSTDALSVSSATGVDLFFAMRAMGVAAVFTGLWF